MARVEFNRLGPPNDYTGQAPAAESQPVLHLDLEPRLQFIGSVRLGVLDGHPPDLHTPAPPLGVPH
jgi:hypothetical protein